MSTNEVAISIAWMTSTLAGDTTLQGYAPGGVLRAFALPGTTAPYVVITYQPGNSSDGTVFGGGRAFSQMEFEVVVVGSATSSQALFSAAARIDALLTVTTQTTVTGGTIIASYRIQPIESDVPVDKEIVTNLGGIYRIMAKSS